MSRPRLTARSWVHVTCHQFWVADLYATPSLALGSMRSNGLVVADDGVAVILTGIHTGNVDVTVELHDRRPQIRTEGWDEVAEVDLYALDGVVRVAGLMNDPPDELPVLNTGPENCRLRIHARGRDNAVDLVAREPVEDYLLAVWAAPSGPDVLQADRLLWRRAPFSSLTARARD